MFRSVRFGLVGHLTWCEYDRTLSLSLSLPLLPALSHLIPLSIPPYQSTTVCSVPTPVNRDDLTW